MYKHSQKAKTKKKKKKTKKTKKQNKKKKNTEKNQVNLTQPANSLGSSQGQRHLKSITLSYFLIYIFIYNN